MTSFKEEFMRSRELAEVGVEAELYRNDDGMLLVRQVPPPPVTITPEGDIDMGTVGEAVQELPEALAAGASGLAQGATAATVGLPGDLVAIGNAAVDYFNQGDVAQALTILSDMSEQYGSGRVKQFFDENLPEVFSDKAKVAADVSRTYGEFGGVGSAAVAGARQVPPALRAIDRAGQRAQSRLDENVGTTLMSGIDPKRAADELTAGAGQVARLMLPDVQKQMKMDKRMSMQPPAVLEALTDQDRELIKKLAGEKRASESVEPGLDDMSIIDADEFMRARSKQEPTPPPPPARKQDELGFYSRAQEFIDNLKQEKLTGQQLKGQMLNAGVKPDELKWTGLDEFLEKNPKLTKQEAMDFIEDNKVRLEEITYEGGTLNPETHLNFTPPEIIKDYDAINFQRERIDEDINDGDDFYLNTALENRGYDVASGVAAYKELMQATGGRFLNVEPEVLAPIQAKYPDVDVKNVGWEVDAELTEIARENYYDNPYYEVDGEGALEGYRIVGNDDTGYYITYQGSAVSDTQGVDIPYSLNEAQVQVQADAMDRGLSTGAGETQYSEYTQEGAENYREVLLTNPGYKGDPSFKLNEAQEARLKELGDKIQAEKERRPSQVVVSSSEALGVADANEFEALKKQQRLSKVMENRMPSPHWQEDDVVAHARLSDRTVMGVEPVDVGGGKRRIPKALYIEELQSDWAQTGRRAGFGAKEKEFYIYEFKDPQTDKPYFVVYDIKGDEQLGDSAPITFARGEKQFATRKQAEEAIEYEKKMMPKRVGTPEGPLVGTTEKFTEATMRRLIRKAADEGYDYIAWTPGDVQVDRWGEQGLETYYNKVLPKSTKKVAQSLDKEAKVEPIEISIDGEPQKTLALRITDKLKKMAKEGQPLFAVPAAAGAGAALTSKEERNGNL